MASYNQANGHLHSRPSNSLNTQSAPTSTAPKWPAAALLNPTSQKPQPLSENKQDASGRSSNPPNLVFQFDSPDESHGFAQYAQPPQNTNGNGFAQPNGYGPGMGAMLQRMHNISDRDLLPQKRRKIELGNAEYPAKKAAFSDGGQGGVLGDYMKEKREEGQREAAIKGTAPVDLTADDDDEVTILGSSEDKEVCFGRIEGCDINAHKVPTAREGTRALSRDFWPQVKVVLKRTLGEKTSIVKVVDSTREIIGCLDVNTSIGLVPILDSRLNVRTSARILTRQKKPGDLPPGADCSCRFNLDLTLYGPKKYAAQIGKHLSQKQLWLRTPLSVEAGIELCNPHAVLKQMVPRPGGRCVGYTPVSSASMRTVEEIRSDVFSMFDSLQQSENLLGMEPDARITTELLPHQKQGLAFMTSKEKERVYGDNEKENSSLWRLRHGNNGQRIFYNVITGQEERESPPQVLGGILADMMGLGKTLSILSLIASSMEQSKEWCSKKPPPPAEDEVKLKRNAKTTLLVSPLSTIANWEEQIQQHIKPNSLKYHVYHGGTRCRDIAQLSEYDLIITTYGSVASECNRRSKGKPGPYPLEEINWFRIVLDEAHMIREQATLQSKAICRLQAQRRWAVTGTPVQNRLDDLGALIKFLRLKPFDEKRAFAQYILAPCKNADPEILPKLRLLVDSITLRRLKDRINLPPRHDKIVRLNFSPQEQELYDIFAKNASDRVKVLTSQQEKSLGGRAYVHILQSILRLRLICAHGRELLGDEDLKLTAGITKDSAIDLDEENDTDQPALSPKQAYEMYNLMKETNADVCSMCNVKIGRSSPSDSDSDGKDEVMGYMTPCYHLICPGCIKEYKTSAEAVSTDNLHASCYICKQYIRIDYFALKAGKIEQDENDRAEIKDGKYIKALGRYNGPHTKTKALIHDLLASKAESELMPDQPPIKSVVFSGWTSHLDLIQMALEDNGISYTRLDGKMSRTARATALEVFRTNPLITVILVSINAGGLGLNLTTANKVYVMEPQYNPAAEAQAIDRVHRLGQKREVETVRYVMNHSFEEKMLELQEKKMKLASLSLDRDKEGMRGAVGKAEATKKRLEDLRSLFK